MYRFSFLVWKYEILRQKNIIFYKYCSGQLLLLFCDMIIIRIILYYYILNQNIINFDEYNNNNTKNNLQFSNFTLKIYIIRKIIVSVFLCFEMLMFLYVFSLILLLMHAIAFIIIIYYFILYLYKRVRTCFCKSIRAYVGV